VACEAVLNLIEIRPLLVALSVFQKNMLLGQAGIYHAIMRLFLTISSRATLNWEQCHGKCLSIIFCFGIVVPAVRMLSMHM